MSFILPGSSGGGGSGADVQEFSVSGTWTKPSSGTIAIVELWAGGGGGGSGAADAVSPGSYGGGSGGGGGAYRMFTFKLSDLTATVAVTIGAGGAGGAAQGNGVNNPALNGNPGTAGGNTSFGAFLVSYGGAGGPGGSITTGQVGAGGGVLGAPTVISQGGPPSNSNSASVVGIQAFDGGGSYTSGYKLSSG